MKNIKFPILHFKNGETPLCNGNPPLGANFVQTIKVVKVTCKSCLKILGIKEVSLSGTTAGKAVAVFVCDGVETPITGEINGFEFKINNGFEIDTGKELFRMPAPQPVRIRIELDRQQTEFWKRFFNELPLKP